VVFQNGCFGFFAIGRTYSRPGTDANAGRRAASDRLPVEFQHPHCIGAIRIGQVSHRVNRQFQRWVKI
jgi:hypothetical protein